MILDYKYVAGLFDGEGWFELNRSSGKRWRMKREYAYFCRAGLQIREKYIIESLQETFGGKIYTSKPKSDKHSVTYKWNVFGNQAVCFADKVAPFLLAKKQQAEILVQFQAQKKENGNKALSDERYALYGELHEKMKILNKRGVGK
jgi:hypothetical protein